MTSFYSFIWASIIILFLLGLVKYLLVVYNAGQLEPAMKGFLICLGIIGVASICPIWRGAGYSRHDGISFWKLLHDSTRLTPDSPFGHPHLPYSEAERLAQEAYQEALRAHGS